MSATPVISSLPPPTVRWARLACLILCAALVLLGLLWELWLAPTGRGTWAIKVLPLAAALPGLWRYRLYTARWLSLLVWAYSAEGLIRALTESMPSAALAATQTLLAVGLFAACTVQIRLRLAMGPHSTVPAP
ncbi:MAG: DUF2069 domain-containing protein [Leptothrix ochracea]|uniref:DUF2069 domain-containing protein n=1 Tax=Leptothrix ochracea TaxID=735331 RepID=UPI0034E1988E